MNWWRRDEIVRFGGFFEDLHSSFVVRALLLASLTLYIVYCISLARSISLTCSLTLDAGLDYFQRHQISANVFHPSHSQLQK